MDEFDLDAFPRPYLNTLTREVKTLAIENWNSWRDLIYIWVELRHRHRKMALQLLDQVDGRIIELIEQGFPFPSTHAPIGTGKLGDVNWEKVSLLRLLGYSVAQGGEPEAARRRRLDRTYLESVPIVISRMVSPVYLAKWGHPQTGARLRQMAENIASSVRNAKRRTAPPRLAIAKWEADLDYLKRTYYVDCYDFRSRSRERFPWPSTDI